MFSSSLVRLRSAHNLPRANRPSVAAVYAGRRSPAPWRAFPHRHGHGELPSQRKMRKTRARSSTARNKTPEAVSQAGRMVGTARTNGIHEGQRRSPSPHPLQPQYNSGSRRPAFHLDFLGSLVYCPCLPQGSRSREDCSFTPFHGFTWVCPARTARGRPAHGPYLSSAQEAMDRGPCSSTALGEGSARPARNRGAQARGTVGVGLDAACGDLVACPLLCLLYTHTPGICQVPFARGFRRSHEPAPDPSQSGTVRSPL